MLNLNPLDVLGQREVNILPPHFSKISIPIQINNMVKNWINCKLKGRYCILKIPGIDQQRNLKSLTIVGFEDPKELTYFMLACPHLRRN